MATFTAKLYGQMFECAFNKEIDWQTDTQTVLLTTVTEVPDQDNDKYLSDVSANEVSGGGYARQNLGSKTDSYDGSSNKYVMDAADTVFTTATFTFRNVHIADTANVGGDTVRPLIGYQTADANVTGAGGDLTLQWNSGGIVEITVA